MRDAATVDPLGADAGGVPAKQTDFMPVSTLLAPLTAIVLDAARSRIAKLSRDDLIAKFRDAVAGRKRVSAFLIADALVMRGVPPFVWHDWRSPPKTDTNSLGDMATHDLRWVRHAHAPHLKAKRAQRWRNLVAGGEAGFHRDVEFLFWGGRRPPWQIVQFLSLSDAMQFECAHLRSGPIVKRYATTQAMRTKVFATLQASLKAVHRKANFSEDDARATLLRRHRLWMCSRMSDGTPTDAARIYGQMTGEVLTRQAVHRQLEIVGKALSKTELTESEKMELFSTYVSPLPNLGLGDTLSHVKPTPRLAFHL